MLIGGTYAVPSIGFSPDSNTLAIANGEYIRLRDPSSESITGTILSEVPVYTIEYSPDGKKLAAGDISNGIQIWDPSQAFRTGAETYPTPLKLAGHTARPTSFLALIWDIAFNLQGTVLASAGGDGIVRLWDVNSGELLSTLAGHEDAVTSLSFSPDGSILVSGGLDGRLLLWGMP
jgi:WD40 repeat protein